LGNWTMTGAGGSPTGITLDPSGASQDLWVVDNATDRVYQYAGARSRTSGSQAAASSFALAAGNTNPQGIADPPPAADRVDQHDGAARSAGMEPRSGGVWWPPSDASMTGSGWVGVGDPGRISIPPRTTASFDGIRITSAATTASDRAGDNFPHAAKTVTGTDIGNLNWEEETLFVPRLVPVDADAVSDLAGGRPFAGHG